MNLPYFIAKRISDPGGNSFSSIIHKIAIASVAIGLAIMIVSFLILGGFQQNIKQKIFSFAGHIQVTKFSLDNSFEQPPISIDPVVLDQLRASPHISHIQGFALKPGLLSVNDEVFGVLFKGVGSSFDPRLFEDYMVAGTLPAFKKEEASLDIMVSRQVAADMQLQIGDRVVMYFVQDPPRNRRLRVTGIFDTGLEEFDEKIIVGDIDLIRRLNDWKEDEVGGYEVFVEDFDEIDDAEEQIIDIINPSLTTKRADDEYLEMFEWLALLNQNVFIFLGLILFVACFNMVSVLFILIMERTQMIGILKALGASNKQVRRIFANNGFRLVLKGCLIGNLIAIGFGALQYYLRLIPLDPQNYFMAYVPISWNWWITIGINALSLGAIFLMLFIPTSVISRVQPVKAIRFD